MTTRLMALCLGALFALGVPLAAAPTDNNALLVDLDARDPSAGTATWQNRGTLGAFEAVGHPVVATVDGIRAVSFDGLQDAYRGPVTPPALEGNAPRTIEVWAYNPTLDSDEETLVSWGKRGGPDPNMLAFGWGRSTEFGAAAHWSADLGWNGVPTAKHWHYLVYTYDGTTVRIYDDGLEKNTGRFALHTATGLPILIGVQMAPSGLIQFTNEYTGKQQAGSLAIASVRIRAGALTAPEIVKNFDAEAGRYGASRADAEGLLSKGLDRFNVGPFTLTLLRATQTAVSLSPRGAAFDFLPGDRVAGRLGDGNYHLGDVTLKTRVAGGAWKYFSSARTRDGLAPGQAAGTLAVCDLTPSLGADCPVKVTRQWVNDHGKLSLRFRVANRTAQTVELGAFGAAMVFNNLLTGRSLEDTHEKCSFATPYVGGPAGYVQVTRLNGQGPALVVYPESGTSIEAYRPLTDDPTTRGATFEGFYEAMTHSKAYAENEWKNAAGTWNPPTSRLLKPGETATYGYQFALSPTIKQIESTLIAQKRPVVVGVPGYVLPNDVTGRLFVHSAKPIKSFAVTPTGALRWQADRKPTPHGWRGYTLHGGIVGRCRLTITYADGLQQFVQYFVTPPEAEQVRRLGAFQAAKQWFDDPNDPFHRTDSFMPYDRVHHQMILQSSHSWVSGLSDEIGAGASVAMALKNYGQPNAHQVELLEKYANTALWGHVQNPDYSVRASLFYYDPKALPDFPYMVHSGWDKARSETTWRTFNYPHVTAVYWALYHLARDHQGLVKQRTWDWYLDHAYHTAMAIPQFAPGYAQYGLMVGSVFPSLIKDLRREGWNDKADKLETYMHQREQHWRTLRYPFGSEMPWDSTGQSEVYTWSQYFGDTDKAKVTLDAVLGYMPTVPNWAYNGAARRYFDAPVNGNYWPEIIQTTNHYGAAINAIPVLDAYKRDPSDLYLLRVGYAGMDEILANIDPQGFASYGFNTDPIHLDFDPYTADYGIAFFGYARNAGTYVLHNPEFGWLGFGGDVQETQAEIEVTPRDGFHKRVFLAPFGLWLTLDAGTFKSVTFNPKTGIVRLTLDPSKPDTPRALLRIGDTPAGVLPAQYAPISFTAKERGAYVIPLNARGGSLTLKPLGQAK